MLQETVDKLFAAMMEYIQSENNYLPMTDDDLKSVLTKIVANYGAACILDSGVRDELGV